MSFGALKGVLTGYLGVNDDGDCGSLRSYPKLKVSKLSHNELRKPHRVTISQICARGGKPVWFLAGLTPQPLPATPMLKHRRDAIEPSDIDPQQAKPTAQEAPHLRALNAAGVGEGAFHKAIDSVRAAPWRSDESVINKYERTRLEPGNCGASSGRLGQRR